MPTVTGQLATYDVTGRPRDLMDMITMISPTDTPFYTDSGTAEPAAQTLHEWTKDELADPADNAQIEGFDVTQYQENNVLELKNRTQIFTKAINVSGSAQAIKQAGVSNQYARQMANRMKEIKKDGEYAMLANAVDAVGSKTVARHMRGLSAWITTNADLGAGGAVATASAPAVAGTKRALTNDMIANIMQKAYEKGGNPKMLMAAPAVRRKVTKVLKAVNEQDEDASAKKATDTIKIYDSDFGELRVVSNRVQAKVPYAQNTVFILDMEYWKKSFLKGRTFQEEKLAKTGDSMKGFIVGEFTLEARAEESSGMIADIDPTL